MMGTEKKGGPTSPSLPGVGTTTSTALKRSSVHLRMEGGDRTPTHPPTTPRDDGDFNAPSTAAATGGHTLNGSVDFEVSEAPVGPLPGVLAAYGTTELILFWALQLDNPFGDHARSSVGTSDFSFRSSHSTNIIPIAYIPPHSSSVSLEDANRGAYGELLHESHNPERILGGRGSVPASLASRDSLALAGADQINLNPLPPVLSSDSPLVPLSASAGGAPIRPPRSPGLDLQLPKGSLSTTTSSIGSPGSPTSTSEEDRPHSGFPWSTLPPPPNSGSHFSMATSRASANSYLTAPSASGVGSFLTAQQQSHMSTMSNMSSFTTRSAGSTMSYILDPPQIITPVNAQGLRRVEVLGRGQAGLVRLQGSAPSSAPSAAASSPITSPASTSSPTTPRAFEKQQAATPAADVDPFSDLARLSLSQAMPPRQDSDDEAETIDESHDFDGSARWTMSSAGSRMSEAQIMTVSSSAQAALAASANTEQQRKPTSFYDVPHSARSSAVSVGDVAYDTGNKARRLTGGSAWSGDSGDLNASRESFASSRSGATDSLSMLDGIPFMRSNGASTGDLTKLGNSSPLFPMPPARAPSVNNPPSPTNSSTSLEAPQQFSSAPSALAQVISANSGDLSPLPEPFLPFAGQRPTGGAPGSRVQSQAMSVRSGFGSGLSQIPFQLGFPSGFDGSSERGSIMSMGSHDSLRLERSRYEIGDGEGNEEEDAVLSRVEEQTEPPSSRRGSVESAAASTEHRGASVKDTRSGPSAVVEEEDEENPFGDGFAADGPGVRASTDTLALSADLARNFEALDH
ncbi:hypothetical protein P7C70_g673, partial [Phenoliferia sp. Uapishka_3]